jgi:hypothetical protein
VKLYFDEQSHLLVKRQHKVKSVEQGFTEVEQEMIIKSYQDVGGAKLPSEVVINRDGQKYVEAKLFDIEPVEEFGEDVFAEP